MEMTFENFYQPILKSQLAAKFTVCNDYGADFWEFLDDEHSLFATAPFTSTEKEKPEFHFAGAYSGWPMEEVTTLQHAATCCNRCNTQPLTVTQFNCSLYFNSKGEPRFSLCGCLFWLAYGKEVNTLQYAATHCNTLQHTATHCNTLWHSATAPFTYAQKENPEFHFACAYPL